MLNSITLPHNNVLEKQVIGNGLLSVALLSIVMCDMYGLIMRDPSCSQITHVFFVLVLLYYQCSTRNPERICGDKKIPGPGLQFIVWQIALQSCSRFFFFFFFGVGSQWTSANWLGTSVTYLTRHISHKFVNLVPFFKFTFECMCAYLLLYYTSVFHIGNLCVTIIRQGSSVLQTQGFKYTVVI